MTKQKITVDAILKYLYPYGVSGKEINLNPFIKRYHPKGLDTKQAMAVKLVCLEIVNKEYAYIDKESYRWLGDKIADIYNPDPLAPSKVYNYETRPITAILKQGGLDYYRSIEPRWLYKQIIGFSLGLLSGLILGLSIPSLLSKFQPQSLPMEQTIPHKIPNNSDSLKIILPSAGTPKA